MNQLAPRFKSASVISHTMIVTCSHTGSQIVLSAQRPPPSPSQVVIAADNLVVVVAMFQCDPFSEVFLTVNGWAEASDPEQLTVQSSLGWGGATIAPPRTAPSGVSLQL